MRNDELKYTDQRADEANEESPVIYSADGQTLTMDGRTFEVVGSMFLLRQVGASEATEQHFFADSSPFSFGLFQNHLRKIARKFAEENPISFLEFSAGATIGMHGTGSPVPPGMDSLDIGGERIAFSRDDIDLNKN